MNGVAIARAPERPSAKTAEPNARSESSINNATASAALSDVNLSNKTGSSAKQDQRAIHDEAGKEFKGKLNPDKVEREVGPSIWAAIAAGAYRFAGQSYSPPGTRTLGVDMGEKTVPSAFKAEPTIKLGDNTGPVSVRFSVKDDEKVYVGEARIVANDGKTILDKAKSTGWPGEFVFGNADNSYPEGSFLVYKLSNGASYHMSLRKDTPTAP